MSQLHAGTPMAVARLSGSSGSAAQSDSGTVAAVGSSIVVAVVMLSVAQTAVLSSHPLPSTALAALVQQLWCLLRSHSCCCCSRPLLTAVTVAS